jgi:hypothetical protein
LPSTGPQQLMGGGRRDPLPPPKRERVASTKRSSGPQPLPSSAVPELAPRPWDPILVPTANATALLFLLPGTEPRPPRPIFRPRSSYSSPPPGVLQASPCCPPLPPDGYNNADNQRSVDTARDLLLEDNRLRAAQSALLSSPPPRAGGCMRGAEHQRPVTPGIAQPLGQVPPRGYPLLL